MEEFYQQFLGGEDCHVAQEDDPFWDPVEVVHLGSAHIWLQSLAYCTEFENQVEFLNCNGLEEAVLHIHIIPCSMTGQAHGEDDVVIDPLELLGKRTDFQIYIVLYLGINWLKEDAKRGIQIGYQPALQNCFSQTTYLVIPDGKACAELSCSQLGLMVTGEGRIMVDTKKMSTGMETVQTIADQISELHLKLLKLEQETELLRNINRALREENVLLKESLEKTGSSQQAHKSSNTLRIPGMASQLPSARQLCPQHVSYDGEFAKALKMFYQSMNMARGQFLRLRHYKPPEDDQRLRPLVHQRSQMLKDFGDLVECSLWKLKNDVAFIVKKKRECLLHFK